jgi:hypothetical protein
MYYISVNVLMLMYEFSYLTNVQVLGQDSEGPLAQEFVFDALQCSDVRTTASYSGRKFCKKEMLQKEMGMGNREPWGDVTVIQKNPSRKFKGIRCAKKISTITAICGAFSHNKLVAPPDVLMPVPVLQKDCALASQSLFWTTEDQRQIRLTIGATHTYKYIESGSVTLSEGNVVCEGGEMKIRGKKHENLIRLVTVNFEIMEVDVYERQNKLRSNVDGILPRMCNLAFEGCSLETFTLVLDLSKINLCPFVRVRTANFEQMISESEPKVLSLVNDEHKLVFEVKERIDIPSECNLSGTLMRTNFDRIYLYNGVLGTGIDLIEPSEIDLELETRVTDYYLAHWAENVMQENEIKWRTELCDMASQRLSNDQIILHDRHLLRMRGELVLEFECKPILVRTRSGHKMEGDTCLDHLPVFLPNDKIGYLSPITRIIVQRDSVSTINCSNHYPLVFEDKNGQMITANPEARVIKVNLADHHFLDASSENHSSVFKFSSLLYTPEEVIAYEQMLQGNSAEKAVTKKFSSFYCGTTGECTPSRGKNDFQWNKLMDPEQYLSEQWQEMKEKLLVFGSCWGIACSILTAGHFVAKMVIVLRNIGKRRLTKGAIFRFVFLPGQELVSLFPRQEGAAHYQRTESEGQVNIDASELQSLGRNQ